MVQVVAAYVDEENRKASNCRRDVIYICRDSFNYLVINHGLDSFVLGYGILRDRCFQSSPAPRDGGPAKGDPWWVPRGAPRRKRV